MPLERARAAPAMNPTRCVEEGCDRVPPAGEARCQLHASRLGRLPAPLAQPAPRQHAAVAAPQPAGTSAAAADHWPRDVLLCAASVLAFWTPFIASLAITLRELADHPLPFFGMVFLAIASIITGPVFGVRALGRADTPLREGLSWVALVLGSVPAVGIACALLVALLSM